MERTENLEDISVIGFTIHIYPNMSPPLTLSMSHCLRQLNVLLIYSLNLLIAKDQIHQTVNLDN